MVDESIPVFDPATPADARIYDYLVGGKDNFAADRGVAENLRKVFKDTPPQMFPAVENRRFLKRAVAYLLSVGIRQFLDVGCGLPTRRNVHQIVQAVDSRAPVVYVDHDPVVITHYRALLSHDSSATVIHADARRPMEILLHPEVKSRLDFDRPVGILLVGLLHLIADEEDPAGIVAQFRDAMSAGSHLALSHLTDEGPDPEAVAQFISMFAHAREPMILRQRAHIRSFFDGMDLVEPGLVDGANWHPDGIAEPSRWLMAGIGRKQPQ